MNEQKFKIKDNVDLKDREVVSTLYRCGLRYEWLINGHYETNTVVKDKNKPLTKKNVIKVYNPFERFDSDELMIFLWDEHKLIVWKWGYDENNSEIFKKLEEAGLVEKMSDEI